MKRIACIHTVYSVIDSFTKQLREGIPGEFLIHTVYDDFLATDPSPAQSGKFTPINHQRLRLDMQAQALTGADVIVVTAGLGHGNDLAEQVSGGQRAHAAQNTDGLFHNCTS